MATGHAARVDAAVAAGAKSGSFAVDVSKWAAKAKAGMAAVMKRTAFELSGRVIERTPVDTGLAKSSWRMSAGSPDLSAPDSPGSIPNVAQEVGNWDPETQKSFFTTNSLPYMERLEYGWSNQAPAGMVRVTVAEFADVVQGAVVEVRSGRGGDL